MTQNESVAILNSYQKLWTEHLALRVERDTLRAQLDAIRYAWERPTGWPAFGHDVEAILRGDYQPSPDSEPRG